MKGSTPQLPDPNIDRADTEPEEFSTNQEGSVLPWLCGEQKMALRWVSPIYNQFTAESGDKRAIHTTGVGAISIDSFSVLVVACDRLEIMSVNSLAVGVVAHESRVLATELNTLSVGVVGNETLTQAQSLDSLAVLIIGQETL